MRNELVERGLTEDVADQPLLSLWLLESLLPVQGRELEDTATGPARQEAEQVPQVTERLDTVQLGAGEQRDEDGIDLPRVVVSDEEPIPPGDDLPAQRQLRRVVVDRQTSVFEKMAECVPLIAR